MFIREPAQRCSMGICSIIRMPPGGGLVICEEVGVRALGRRERIVIERCAGHRAVIPALRLEIRRDLLCLEDAAVARKDLVAGKAALLPREVGYVCLREPAHTARRRPSRAPAGRRSRYRPAARLHRPNCRRGRPASRRRHPPRAGHPAARDRPASRLMGYFRPVILPAAPARPRSRGTSAHRPGYLVCSRHTALASPALSHTQIVFLNVPYSRPYRKDKKCPPVFAGGQKKRC